MQQAPRAEVAAGREQPVRFVERELRIGKCVRGRVPGDPERLQGFQYVRLPTETPCLDVRFRRRGPRKESAQERTPGRQRACHVSPSVPDTMHCAPVHGGELAISVRACSTRELSTCMQ